MNDALARFQAQVTLQDDFLSVTGSEDSRAAESDELEELHARVAALELQSRGVE